MAPERTNVWSTLLTLAVAALLVVGIAMVVVGRVRLGSVELLAIALLVSVFGGVLRSGPLKSVGTTLVLIGGLLVLAVVGFIVLVLVFGPVVGR